MSYLPIYLSRYLSIHMSYASIHCGGVDARLEAESRGCPRHVTGPTPVSPLSGFIDMYIHVR